MKKLTGAQKRILRKSARWSLTDYAIYPFRGTEREIHFKLCKRGYFTVQTLNFAPGAYISGWFLSRKGRQALLGEKWDSEEPFTEKNF